MPRLNTLVFAGLIVVFSGARLAPAQTGNVAQLTVQSGNGQVACICITATLQAFQPISVKATDVNGNPVAGATVSWSVPSGQMTLPSPISITDGTGVATEAISLVVLNNFSSTNVPYLVATIQATSNNSSVTFTETQSLVTSQGSSVIAANTPQFNGAALSEATLSASVGARLSTPIQTQVAGLELASNGVSNVSVRLLNNQSSPSLSCAAGGGYADPGSVLSDSQGNTNCYPVFSGSGTGTFYILVGGVRGNNLCSSGTTPCYLNEFGPYTFTSVPGAPAAVQIVSGNNQVGNIGQQLNPLVAKLVDANGNPVSGQTMVWSVVPAGAVALGNGPFITDTNGEVSVAVTLDILASAGAAITVALQSNTHLSATFQETVLGALTAMNKISGDKQTAQVGTNFANPLVVQILNSSGTVANYPVQYIVNGPVSLAATTVDTNANGDAVVTVLAGNLAGTATVTAVAGALSQSFTLTITTTPTAPPPNGISIVSGNSQSAVVNSTFGQQLVVQVNSTAGPVSGYTVNFSSTGPIGLPSSFATTNGSGQASITVTAGASTGAATVTASVTGFSATFNLTVTPPGPQITASSFLNAASRQVGSLSPCSLAILSAPGLTPNGTIDYTLAPIFGRLPKSVHNLTVTFAGVPAPIVSVAMGATNPEVTLQVPCEVTPASNVPVVVNVNGGGSAATNIPINTVSPGVFQQVMSDGTSRAVAVRSDGTFADVGGTDSYDPNNPVRLNEIVRFYLTGLGATIPAVGTDSIEDPNGYLFGVDSLVTGTVQVGFPGTNPVVLATVISARQAPGLIGVYEVQVQIPDSAPTGNNVPLSIGIVPAGVPSSTPGTPALQTTVPIGQ